MSYAARFAKAILPTFCALFLIPLTALPTLAEETYPLSGLVLDANTAEGLPGANVIIEGTQYGTSTDLDGSFEFHRVPEGEFRLIVSYVGYENVVRSVTLDQRKELNVEVGMSPTMFQLNAVVVTGTRSARYVQDAPVRTEVISSRDLKLRSAANIFEALETAPGLRVESQCQACNFTMVRMNGLGSDHTQILMDGQPVYSGLASVYGLQQFSTTEIDRIEIVKGAGSALYGPNAVAGVVNIITERPSVQHTEVGLEVGQHGTNQLDASAEMLGQNMALSLFAQVNAEAAIDETQEGSTRNEVNHADGITDRVESNTRNFGGNLFFDNLFVADDEVSFRLRYMNEKRVGGEMTGDAYLNPYTAGTEHISTDRITGTVGYRAQIAKNTGIDAQLSVVNHARNATNDTYLNDYMDTHAGLTPDVKNLRPYLADEQMFVAGANLSQAIGRHRFNLGAQYSYDELEETGRYVIVEEDDPQYGFDYTSISNKHAHDFGVYLQDEWRISNQWELVYGVRGDLHNSEDSFSAEETGFSQVFESTTYDETSWNPRFALKYSPSSDWTFRANYGTGFRVPYGFSEDLHLCSGSPRVWKGSELVPERSQSINLSGDYTGHRTSFGVNAYATRLYDAIGIANADQAARAKGYHYAYQNVDNATVFGLDFNATVQLARRLQLNGDFSWFQGEYDSIRGDWAGTPYEQDSKMVSRFPAFSGGLRIDWAPSNWELTFDSQYTGSMYIDYAEDGDLENAGSKVFETDPYVILNTQVSYRFGNQYRIYLGVRNLSDYLQPVKHVGDAAFYYAPMYGRILYSGIRIEL